MMMVSEKKIDEMLKEANIKVKTLRKRVTVVTCKLANGFIITESSTCLDKNNYDSDIGYDICMKAIKNKLYELEAYAIARDNFMYKNMINSMNVSSGFTDSEKDSFSIEQLTDDNFVDENYGNMYCQCIFDELDSSDDVDGD